MVDTAEEFFKAYSQILHSSFHGAYFSLLQFDVVKKC